MGKEFKAFQISNLKAESSGRVRVGIAAVHGNIDAGRDRSHLGSFAKTIAEGKNRIQHLWNHEGNKPPIAEIKDMKEIGRDELPSEILAKFPDATGGLKVWREYLEKDFPNWVLECIDRGMVTEMSYAYDVVKATYTEEKNEAGENMMIRELQEVRLYDISDVNWGMNPATVANVKGYELDLLPFGSVVFHLKAHIEQFKSGRRNSSSDETLINQIHSLAVDLGALCAPAADEDEKNSKETETKEAGAEEITPLNRDWLDLQQRKRQFLDFYRS